MLLFVSFYIWWWPSDRQIGDVESWPFYMTGDVESWPFYVTGAICAAPSAAVLIFHFASELPEVLVHNSDLWVPSSEVDSIGVG